MTEPYRKPPEDVSYSSRWDNMKLVLFAGLGSIKDKTIKKTIGFASGLWGFTSAIVGFFLLPVMGWAILIWCDGREKVYDDVRYKDRGDDNHRERIPYFYDRESASPLMFISHGFWILVGIWYVFLFPSCSFY